MRSWRLASTGTIRRSLRRGFRGRTLVALRRNRVSRVRAAAQRHLAQQPAEQERETETTGRGQEHGVEGGGERLRGTPCGPPAAGGGRPRGCAAWGRARPAGRRCGQLVASRLAKIAPKSGDADRAADLAGTASSRTWRRRAAESTAFWAARTSTCMTMPRPRPSDQHVRARRPTLERVHARAARAAPGRRSSAPCRRSGTRL